MEILSRKDKENLLLDALGLKSGDVIEIYYYDHENDKAEVKIKEKDLYYILATPTGMVYTISDLFFMGFSKITPKKKKGDLICKGLRIQCVSCPLFSRYCTHDMEGKTLNEILEIEKDNFDSRVYKAYKSVLDDEVEE